MKCDQCTRDLVDGDAAYIQEYRQITVRGTKVREAIIDRIVCADCAADAAPAAAVRGVRRGCGGAS